MRKFLMIIVSLVCLSPAANAQLWKLRRYEVTAGLGTTQFYGDIGGYSKGENLLGIKDFTFHNTGINMTTSLKYRALENVSVRLNLAFGSFHSIDEKGSNESRGFESKTPFFEPTILGEYYFIKNKGENSFLSLKGHGGNFKSFLSLLDLYAFTGFGGLYYKVKPNDVLAPRVSKTSGFAAVIPLGVGVSLFYSANFNLGIELSGRFTFSDNIDGYTSAHSKSNDVYHFLNFMLTYKINKVQEGLQKF